MSKVKDIISIGKGVLADRTLREFDQLLRIDLLNEDTLKCQILFTRRHLENLKQSKNVGYLTFSRVSSQFDLASYLLATAVVTALQHHSIEEALKRVNEVAKSFTELQVNDVSDKARKYLLKLKETK